MASAGRLAEAPGWCLVWIVLSIPVRREVRRHEDGPSELQSRLFPPLAHGWPVWGLRPSSMRVMVATE